MNFTYLPSTKASEAKVGDRIRMVELVGKYEFFGDRDDDLTMDNYFAEIEWKVLNIQQTWDVSTGTYPAIFVESCDGKLNRHYISADSIIEIL